MTRRSRGAGAPPVCRGFASLVGAGPGDPDLLTWRAIQRLQSADLVLYDGLVPRDIVRLATSAECVSVSKRAGRSTLSQEAVSDRMIAAARRGQLVVRLKSGDPFVLGRGGEEALALARAGVPFEVVPGVTTATSAPALAGIPVTHRGVASAFVVVSGHAAAAYVPIVRSLPPGAATLVVLMGMAERARLAAHLTAAGWPAATPAAIIVNASQPGQRVWTGTIATLGHEREGDGREDPGVIVIGEVVALAAESELILPFSLQEHSWQPTTIPGL
jgi:uroporphyrin-III C-methyltransferase/precorrin-2 dehydrogenase/sirohydrochlorin ferrochelatase